jgi:hypothetical protein
VIDSDKPSFVELLCGVMSTYGKDLSATVIDIWWETLKEFDLDDVRAALNLHLRDPDKGQFPPRVADVTRFLEGSTNTQAQLAWQFVVKTIRGVGQYESVAFEDTLIAVVIDRMGGWVALCNTPEADLPFRARDFERCYAGLRSNRAIPVDAKQHLVGLSEQHNRSEGYAVPEPRQIGQVVNRLRLPGK